MPLPLVSIALAREMWHSESPRPEDLVVGQYPSVHIMVSLATMPIMAIKAATFSDCNHSDSTPRTALYI